MYDVIRVHIGESLDKLIHNIFNQLGFEAIGGFLKDLKQVIFNIFKHQIHNSFPPEGVSEFDYVGVFHIFQYLDLAHGDFADEFVVFGLLELFDSEDLLGLVGSTLEDDPIGALAND